MFNFLGVSSVNDFIEFNAFYKGFLGDLAGERLDRGSANHIVVAKV